MLNIFQNCSGLTSITIPNSVTTIGEGAFSHCSGLKEIISEISSPFEIDESVFGGIYSRATLTVPFGTKSAYQSTKYWNKFENIVESTSQYKSLNDYIANSSTTNSKDGELVEITPMITGIKKVYIDLQQSTTNGAYCFMSFHNESETQNIDISSRGLQSSTSHNLISRYKYMGNIKEYADNKTYSWLYYNPENNNEVIIDIEQYFGGVGHIKNWQRNFGTSCVVNIVTAENPESNMTITANNYTREYGDDNPNFGYTVSGGSIDGTPKITCSATKTSPVGTYIIKIEKGSMTTGNVTYVDGTLTITKAPLTITAKSYTRKQGESNPNFEVTYSGFKNDETSSVLTKKPTCSTTATKDSPAGTYDITVSGAEAQNYDISYVKGTLTVTQDNSSTKRTIHVATAGTLPDLISESEKYTIEELTLTGELNGTDFRLLRDMAGNNYKGMETEGRLRILDLSDIVLKKGNDSYLDAYNVFCIYQGLIRSTPTSNYTCLIQRENVLPNYLFVGCPRLVSISLPKSVTIIGNETFRGCTGLSFVNFQNVCKVGHNSFYMTLWEDNLPDGLIYAGKVLYKYKGEMPSNTEIVIEEGTQSIHEDAFSGYKELSSIIIPNSIEHIGFNAFRDCI